MVTRNRRFASPYGYSRQHEKRHAERLVAEDMTQEVAGNAPLAQAGNSRLDRHVVLDLQPHVAPRPGVDLRAAVRGTARADRAIAAGPDLKQLLGRLLVRSGRQVWRGLVQFAQRTQQTALRLGRRFVAWLSWK
jgi:hypothetical protein